MISNAGPFGRLWYDTPDNAIGYAEHYSRSYAAVIRVYDAAGNVMKRTNTRAISKSAHSHLRAAKHVRSLRSSGGD